MDIADALQDLGALVTATSTLKQAVLVSEHNVLSSAIADYRLRDENASKVCVRLQEREIPFLLFSAQWDLPRSLPSVPKLPKPAMIHDVIDALLRLPLK